MSPRRISLFAICTACGLFAQIPGAAGGAKFEVASVKPDKSGDRGVVVRVLNGGRFEAQNTPLKLLIRVAYNIEVFQISGGPAWMSSDPYSVNAKAEGDATFEQIRPMLQSLLADRFKLRLHRETKDVGIYELVEAKGGIKFGPSKPGSCITPDRNNPPSPPGPGGLPPRFCDNVRIGAGLIDAIGISMPKLAEALSDNVGRKVIDKTGLAGKFDARLEFTPEEAIVNPIFGGRAGQAAPTDSTGPSIITALQEQLGLRLESKKGPVQVLVIDHVERPSEN